MEPSEAARLTLEEVLQYAPECEDARGVNSGECDIFAELLRSRLGSGAVIEYNDERRGLYHFWVEYEGKFYDSESLDGAKSWKDLEWAKRHRSAGSRLSERYLSYG